MPNSTHNNDIDLKSIQKNRKQQLLADIKAAYEQLGTSLSEVDKNRIQRQINSLESELSEIQNKIDSSTSNNQVDPYINQESKSSVVNNTETSDDIKNVFDFDSLALIKEEHSNNFGTAFHILQDKDFSYFITSAQVIENLANRENIKINDSIAQIVALGNKTGIDLAVLKVTKNKTKFLPILDLTHSPDTSTYFFGAFYKYENRFFIENISGKLESQTPLYDEKHNATIPAWHVKVTNNKNLLLGCSGAPILTQQDKLVFGIIIENNTDTRTGLAISLEALKTLWPNMPPALLSTPSAHKKMMYLLPILEELSTAIKNINTPKENDIHNLIYQIMTKQITFDQAKKEFINIYKDSLQNLHAKQDKSQNSIQDLHNNFSNLNSLSLNKVDEVMSDIALISENIINTKFKAIKDEITSTVQEANLSPWVISLYKEKLLREIDSKITVLCITSLQTAKKDIDVATASKLSHFEDNILKDSKKIIKTNFYLFQMDSSFDKNLYEHLSFVSFNKILKLSISDEQVGFLTGSYFSYEGFLGFILHAISLLLRRFSLPREENIKNQIISTYIEHTQTLSDKMKDYLKSTYLPDIENHLRNFIHDTFLNIEKHIETLEQNQVDSLNSQKQILDSIKNKFESAFGTISEYT